MSHSPAPWRATEFGNKRVDGKLVYDADDQLVPDENIVHEITAADGTLVCGTCDGCHVITGDNARLIVAAPDLLYELEFMVARFKTQEPDVVAHAQKLIAKIRGEK